MKIFDFYIDDFAFACAASFLSGVAAANYGASLWVVGFAATTLGGIAVFLIQRPGSWKLWCVASACLVAGLLYFHIFENAVSSRTNLIFNKKISFSAIVVDEPKMSASEKFLVATADMQPSFAGRVTILAPSTDDIRYGDVISATAKIMPPDATGQNPLIIPAALTVTAHGRGFWLTGALLDFKSTMIRTMGGFLSSDAAGFLAAIAFSAKENLTSGVAAAMAASGTSFLATLYGMKMSILVFFVSNLLLGYIDRRVILGVAVAVALAFTVMAGAPVSAIRAAIMTIVVLWARESGGVLSRRNALAFTAVGMALWDPAVLIDISFLASFGSVVGILYLVPPLWKLFRWTTKGFLNWRENVVMNLAAQLTIIPLIADASGGFPLVSLISGAVLIVFLPLAVCAGWVIGLAGLFLRPVAFMIAPFAAVVAGTCIGIIRFFAAFPFAVSIPWNAWMVAAYYVCLIVFAAVFSKKKSCDVPANPLSESAALSESGSYASAVQHFGGLEKEWIPAKVGDETTNMDD